MRKLKLQVQMTVDGFVGGPNEEMDWMFFNWENKLHLKLVKSTGFDCGIVLNYYEPK
jgi:hypothetical protein